MPAGPVRSGRAIIEERAPCRGFFVVRSGLVRVFRRSPDGRVQVLHHLKPGQSFAEPALLNLGHYPASACAMARDTTLVEVGGEHFLRLFREDSRIAAAMVGSLSAWLLQLVERVEELSVVSAAARLARYLLRLPSSGPLERAAVTLPFSKKDLAAHLSITPETLSRVLRRWRDRELIETRGREVAFLDVRVLEAIADGDSGDVS